MTEDVISGSNHESFPSPEHAGIDGEKGLSEELVGGRCQVAILRQSHRILSLMVIVSTLK